MREWLIRASGPVLIVWAAHLIMRPYLFAFTHGPTEAALDQRILGLDAEQYAILWTAFAPLGIVGFAGLYSEIGSRLSGFGRLGAYLTLAGLTGWFVSGVMQNWIVDAGRDFYTSFYYSAWLLSLLSLLVLAAGLIITGADVRRRRALSQGGALILFAGILLPVSVWLTSYQVGHGDASLAGKLLYGTLSLPYGLCWLRLGLIRARRDTAAAAV